MKAARIVLALVLALTALTTFSPERLRAREPKQQMDQIVTQAKTPADHERLAKMYDAESAKARASAEMHRKMAEAYRKAGGSWVEKLHFDQHCDGLVTSYTTAAEEYEALAKAEREMAKGMK
ncbi:MAG: hypothetical protein HY271_16735 [Deltaproteobacteria bacterium]|nr:hypothetical protein [Deltaproteobacteria bacterium]